MAVSRYYLGSGSVILRTSSPALHNAVQRVLARMGLRPVCGIEEQQEMGAIDLILVSQRVAVPDEATLLCVIRRPRSYDRAFSAWQDSEVLYLSTEASLVEIHFDSLRVRGHIHTEDVSETREAQLFLTLLTTTTMLLVLRERGAFGMHAAALCREESGVLVVGPSDCGKSTLSFSLVRHGWNYLSDDMVTLHEEKGMVEAIPFRRTFALDAEANTFFPELERHRKGPIEFEEEAKRSVSVDTLYPGSQADRCVPRVLLFPEIVNQSQTELRAISQVEALHRLVLQGGLLPTTPGTSQRQMDCLAKLVEQACCYRLFSGRDLLEEPQKASAVIQPLLRQAQAAKEV